MPQVEAGSARAASAAVELGPEQLWLFGGGIDLGALRMERAAIRGAKLAPLSKRAYDFDWADFTRWCKEAGRAPLPASADTVGLYTVDLARRGRAVATISRRCAAIAYNHARAGMASPIDGDVREVLFGLRRKLGTAPTHRKAALSVDELRRMLAACPDDARGARDRALLLVGFASGLRRSELSALDLADVSIVGPGLVIMLKRSKTDQFGAGRVLGVHHGKRRSTCPVRALEAWIRERGNWPGALFSVVPAPACAVTRKRMSGDAIAEAIKAAATRAGLDAACISGHSLRAGCATAAAANGAPELAIMGRTGHKSVTMVERYVRHGTLFAIDPLAGAL